MDEEMVEYEIESLTNLHTKWLKEIEEHQRHIDFTKGIALGLLYGIIGNLFVQFFYPVVEGLTQGSYNNVFWVDTVASVFALFLILFVTIKYRAQLSKYIKEMNQAKDEAEVTQKAVKTREHYLKKTKSE